MSGKPGAIRPDWWSKTFAGAVLGAALALALAGLLLATWPDRSAATVLPPP